ncbi:MAG: serine hydrolase [Betaproteobacteria bacterium]|nr:serine hydrolase [Betaproteobacteria bacterium]
MKLGHRFLLVLLWVGLAWAPQTFAQPLPAVSPEDVGMSSDRLHRIDEAFGREVAAGRIPGAVVMVARQGQLVYSRAFGKQDVAHGKAMPADAIFRIYSMTKPLVSVGAMILVEEGKMQLTDPVSKFLPAFREMRVSVAKVDPEWPKVSYTTVPAAREITIQDLLRHTSGLVYGEITANTEVKNAYAKAGLYSPDMDFDVRGLPPAKEVEALAKAPRAHQPGTVWEYSLATDLLGRVIEAASGQRLADFLSQRIFRPLKMNDTGFWLPPDKLPRLAQPFAKDPATGGAIRLIDVGHVPDNDSGGAGGVSTAADYLRFAQMLLGAGRLDDVRILSRQSVVLMASDHLGSRPAVPASPGELLLGTPGYTFGLGFAVREGAGIAAVPGSPGEFMWAGYAGTYFWIDPQEQLVCVYMSQAPGPMRAYFRRLVKQLVYQALEE